jgi:hypothetical protein
MKVVLISFRIFRMRQQIMDKASAVSYFMVQEIENTDSWNGIYGLCGCECTVILNRDSPTMSLSVDAFPLSKIRKMQNYNVLFSSRASHCKLSHSTNRTTIALLPQASRQGCSLLALLCDDFTERSYIERLPASLLDLLKSVLQVACSLRAEWNSWMAGGRPQTRSCRMDST